MFANKNLKGISINKAINNFTAKSPKANGSQEMPVAQKAIPKNKNVSTIEPKIDDISGATYQDFLRNVSNILTSRFCAIKKAVPDPMAILIDIISEKFVETKRVNITPITKPIYTIFLATIFPQALLAKSVIRNVIG